MDDSDCLVPYREGRFFFFPSRCHVMRMLHFWLLNTYLYGVANWV